MNELTIFLKEFLVEFIIYIGTFFLVYKSFELLIGNINKTGIVFIAIISIFITIFRKRFLPMITGS